MNLSRPSFYLFCSSLILLSACAPIGKKHTSASQKGTLARVKEVSATPVTQYSSPSADSYIDDNPNALLNMLDPDVTDIEIAFKKAEWEKSQGKKSRALFYYVKALQFNNKSIHALENIAMIHQQNGDGDKALRIYQDILKIDNNNLRANEQLGLNYLKNRLKTEAKTYLTKVVEQNESYWKAHNGLGVIADLNKQYDKAIEHYQAALTQNSSNSMLLNNMGYSYYLKADYSKARNYFNQALSFDNNYQRAIYNLALIEIKNKQYSTAVNLFNRVMKPHESYNSVGYLCMLDGEYEIADKYLRQAISESPTYFPKAEANLQQLEDLL
ncbi:MAG: tetratricopeptide repeat protein [Methylococcaceae bacterium]|nr:tetratricopeptide repeat protein [Methylococcaceae bacterium]